MDRPYIICHMTVSLDGKVTGEFLGMPESEAAGNSEDKPLFLEGDMEAFLLKEVKQYEGNAVWMRLEKER